MGKARQEMKKESWMVERTAIIMEIELDNGAIRYNVTVQDEGRKPFLSRWFNDPSPAADLIDKMRGDAMPIREIR